MYSLVLQFKLKQVKVILRPGNLKKIIYKKAKIDLQNKCLKLFEKIIKNSSSIIGLYDNLLFL
jgi:hypothetical protein